MRKSKLSRIIRKSAGALNGAFVLLAILFYLVWEPQLPDRLASLTVMDLLTDAMWEGCKYQAVNKIKQRLY